jgi:hypothetical protein
MTLKEKLQQIIDKNGFATSYMENMMFVINEAEIESEGYFINDNAVFILSRLGGTMHWTLEHCIGEYILLNNLQDKIGLML